MNLKAGILSRLRKIGQHHILKYNRDNNISSFGQYLLSYYLHNVNIVCILSKRSHLFSYEFRGAQMEGLDFAEKPFGNSMGVFAWALSNCVLDPWWLITWLMLEPINCPTWSSLSSSNSQLFVDSRISSLSWFRFLSINKIWIEAFNNWQCYFRLIE